MDDCNCDEALSQIQSFLDGELDPSEHDDIRRHLSDCNPCMDRAEFRRNLKTMISSKCAEAAVPPALLEKIQGAISGPDLPGAGPAR